ncbi:MAG TPA: S-layer protein [Cyanobacteria bacterium UBA8803]|nr:S-layer protein [Cyanobacteria bacterium UBA9273]HBL61283.1 S-layer protein [Cyanobacteria bacterium UBA8803]
MAIKDLLSSLTLLFLMASPTLASPDAGLLSGEEIEIVEAQGNLIGEMEGLENSFNLQFPILDRSYSSDTELDRTISSDNPMAQVTPVSQLRDVQPKDWAFEALKYLAERYDCIAGYSDLTFRGNRAITRYEFAAGLVACLERLPYLATPEDLLIGQRLQQEFASELATLAVRVDSLEDRTGQLESVQFSPTVLFGGQIIAGLAFAAGGKPPGGGETNTIFNHQTQFTTVSSFTGQDRLQLTMATGNFDNFGFANLNSLNTYMALLNYQTGLANDIVLSSLEYRFVAFGDRAVVTVKPVGFSLSDVLTANSPYLDPGRGAISRFAAANPVLQIGSLDSGLGIDWLLDNEARLQIAYGSRAAASPTQGFVGSDRSALGVQLLLKPNATFVTGLAYVNSYSQDGRLDTLTGSFNADTSGTFGEPAQIHALSGSLQWRFAPKMTLGAWGGLIYTDALAAGGFAISTTGLVSLGIEDPFGRRGDFLGLLVGIPPKLLIGYQIERFDQGTSLHLESFYRFRVSDAISVSPGFFIVTDPGHIPSNNTIFVGLIRTTVRF